jgi:hypothetical protein
MRKLIITITSLCVLLLAAYVAYRGYKVWKQSHWLAMAKDYAAKGDVRNEFLSLEQVLAANLWNLEATRMMANLATAQHSEGALRWRKRVLELNPDSLEDRLALVLAAVSAHAFGDASNAIAGVDAAGRKTAPYFNVAGEYALAAGKQAEAQADFAEASRLDPGNPAPQLSLAVVELYRTNELDKSEARIALKRLAINCTNLVIRAQAKRELVGDALRSKDYITAVSFASELTQATNAPWGDRLLSLVALRVSQNNSYAASLAACERDCSGDPEKIRELALWLMDQQQHDHALAWLLSLPLSVQTNPPAAVLISQCQILSRDWVGLQKLASKQTWKNLEFTRHAYLARALREQGLDGAAKAEWDVAMKTAENRLEPLKALFGMTAAWKWRDETQQVLWAIVNNHPKEYWADSELAGELYAAGGTRPLLQLLNLQFNRNPANLDAENNLAITAMLLQANEIQPYKLAQDAYQKAGTNGNYACTYAYSLYLQGKKMEALKIMQSMNPAMLNNASTAGYYGVILKSAGQGANAAPFLKRSLAGVLLPEERDMFQKALQGL